MSTNHAPPPTLPPPPPIILPSAPPPTKPRKKKPTTLTSLTKSAKAALTEYAYALSPSFPKARFQLLSDLHLEMAPPTPRSRIVFNGNGAAHGHHHPHNHLDSHSLPQPPPSPGCVTAWTRRGSVPDTSNPTAHPQNAPSLQQPQDPAARTTGYTTFLIPHKAPYLILAGDIGAIAHTSLYLHFLQTQSLYFDHIYLVLGNHEFYNPHNTSRSDLLTIASTFEKSLPGKLTILNRKRVDLVDRGVTILGCTLNSLITPGQQGRVGRCVNDFRGKMSDGWGVEEHVREFEEDVIWLRKQVEEIWEEDKGLRPGGAMAEKWGSGKLGDGDDVTNSSSSGSNSSKSRWKVVIVTHHAPSYFRTSKSDDEKSGLGSAFATELLYPTAEEIPSEDPEEKRFHERGSWGGGFHTWKGGEKVAVWMFGHTHFCTDWVWRAPEREGGGGSGAGGEGDGTVVGGGRKVRVVSNQRGYWFIREGEKFDPGFVVEV